MNICLKIRILCIFYLLAGTISLYGQKDPAAKKILDTTANLLNKSGGIEAQFSASGSTNSDTQNGTIHFKGNKYHINTPAIQIWYDGKTQWSYQVSNKEVNITNPTPGEQLYINPYSFINLYKNGYNYTMKEKNQEINNQTIRCKMIHLWAENPKKEPKELYITIHPKTYMPLIIRARQKNNNWYVIHITKIRTNQKWNNNFFRFNSQQHPGVEIIDLR